MQYSCMPCSATAAVPAGDCLCITHAAGAVMLVSVEVSTPYYFIGIILGKCRHTVK